MPQQVQEPKPKKKLQVLHEALIKENYKVPTDYEVFERNLADENKSKTFHQALKKNGYKVPIDYDVFARNLEVGSYKKKVEAAPGGEGLPVGSPISGPPEVESAIPPIASPDEAMRHGSALALLQQEPGIKTAEGEAAMQLADQKHKARELVSEVYDPEMHAAKTREDNPFVSFGKSAWNVLAYELPATLAAASAAMAEGTGMGDPGVAPIVGQKTVFDAEYQEEIQHGKKDMVEWAMKLREKGAPLTKDLVNTLDKVHDPIDALNWVSATIGQATAQIPMAAATGGATSIGQEIGSIYLDGIGAIANEKGISPDEVIERKLDEPIFAIAFGATAGILDKIGADKVMGGMIKKDALKKSLRGRALDILGTGGTEASTEYAQTFLEQLGASKVGGKSFSEALEEAQTSQAARDRIEAFAQGLVGGVGLQQGGKGVNRVISGKKAAPGEAIGVEDETPEGISPITGAPVVDPATMQGPRAQFAAQPPPVAAAPAAQPPAPVIPPVAGPPAPTVSLPPLAPPVKPTEEKKEEPKPPAKKETKPTDVHKHAIVAGIDINTPEFKAVSEKITGKKHLDDMTPDELDKMIAYTKEEKAKEAAKTTEERKREAKQKLVDQVAKEKAEKEQKAKAEAPKGPPADIKTGAKVTWDERGTGTESEWTVAGQRTTKAGKVELELTQERKDPKTGKVATIKRTVFSEDLPPQKGEVKAPTPPKVEPEPAVKPTVELAPVEEKGIVKAEEAHDLKVGDEIKVKIFGQVSSGKVTGVGKHKGKIVIDFVDQDGNERFAYGDQIVELKAATPPSLPPAKKEEKPAAKPPVAKGESKPRAEGNIIKVDHPELENPVYSAIIHGEEKFMQRMETNEGHRWYEVYRNKDGSWSVVDWGGDVMDIIGDNKTEAVETLQRRHVPKPIKVEPEAKVEKPAAVEPPKAETLPATKHDALMHLVQAGTSEQKEAVKRFFNKKKHDGKNVTLRDFAKLPSAKRKELQEQWVNSIQYKALIAPPKVVEKPEGVTEEQLDETDPYRNINDPDELAVLYNNEVNSPSSLDNKEVEIARALQRTKVNQDSLLETVGDKNAINSSIAKSYLVGKGKGSSIDTIAQNIGEHEGYVTPDDIWEFMKKYQNGPSVLFQPAGNAVLAKINDRYFELTGKKLNSRTAKLAAAKAKPFEKRTVKDDTAITEGLLEGMTDQEIEQKFRRPLELIEEMRGYGAAQIKELLSNNFVFNEEDRAAIRLIFEYGKTKEGRKRLARIRDEQAKRGDEGTGEGPGLSEVQEAAEFQAEVEDVDYPEHLEQEGEATSEEDFPSEWGAPAQEKKGKKKAKAPKVPKKKKGVKKSLKENEAKLGTVTSAIKAGDHSEARMHQHAELTEQREGLLMKRYEGEQTPGAPFAEPPWGAPTRKAKTPRVQVSPIYGGDVKLLRDIIIDLAKGIPMKIFFSKRPIKGKHARASYNPRNAGMAFKYKGDLDATAHELGHGLDDLFGIGSKIPANRAGDVHRELYELSVHGSPVPAKHPNPAFFRRVEGMAEFVRAYLVNPEKTAKMYPHTTAWFNEIVPKKMIDHINVFGTAIRTREGLPGHKKTRMNVQFDPAQQQGGLADWFKPTSADPNNFRITWMERLAQKITTDKAFFNHGIDWLEIQLGEKLKPENDPRMLARVVLGANEKIDNQLEKGLVNSRNQRVKDDVTGSHMTFEWLIQPFENATEATIKEEQEYTVAYMIAERTVEMAGRFERESGLTGAGAGIETDLAVAIQTMAEFQLESPEKQARVQEAARRYRAYADRNLKYMVEKGRLSQEQYDQIKADNTQYVALQRIIEVAAEQEVIVYTGQAGSLASRADILKKLKGGTELIKNPYEALIKTMIKVTKEADNNEVMQKIRDLLMVNRGIYQGPTKNLSQVGWPAAPEDQNTISIYVNGKKETWAFQQDVYHSIKNLEKATKLPWFLTAAGSILQWSVTNFPVFAVRNRIRDWQQRFIVSNTGAWSGLDIHLDRKLKSDTKDSFQLFGGGQSGYYLLRDDFYYKKLAEVTRELALDKKTILVNPALMKDAFANWYGRVLSKGERATRLEEYRSAYKTGKKQGMDDYNASIYAAYKARDLLDFAVAGEYLRVINQMVPFTNAAVQGLRKTISSAKEDPAGFTMRFIFNAVLPALFTRMLVHMNDKDEEYEEMPDYRRDLFYNIPLGPDVWLAIPKPFELGVLSTSAERVMSKYVFKEEHAMDGYYLNLAKSIWPVDDAAIFGPLRTLAETVTNYDSFRETYVIPPDQNNLKVGLRDTSKASRLGKAVQTAVGLGGHGPGLDARKFDHFVKGQFSYFGDFALRASDIGREDSRYKFSWPTTGLIKGDPLYESKSVQWVLGFVKENGIHYTDRYYSQLNEMIKQYYETTDKKEKEELGTNVRDFARTVREEYETNEHYNKLESQTLDESNE